MEIEKDNDVAPGRFFKISLENNPNLPDNMMIMDSAESEFICSLEQARNELNDTANFIKNNYPDCKLIPVESDDVEDALASVDIKKGKDVISKLTLWMIDHSNHTKH